MAGLQTEKKGGVMQDMTSRMGVLCELMGFLWKRKLYWLIPMLITLAIFAILIIVGSAGPAGVFIYPIF